MIWIVLAMTIAVVVAVAVLGIVAVPALRNNRDVLTARGERVFSRASENAAAVSRVRPGKRDKDARESEKALKAEAAQSKAEIKAQARREAREAKKRRGVKRR